MHTIIQVFSLPSEESAILGHRGFQNLPSSCCVSEQVRGRRYEDCRGIHRSLRSWVLLEPPHLSFPGGNGIFSTLRLGKRPQVLTLSYPPRQPPGLRGRREIVLHLCLSQVPTGVCNFSFSLGGTPAGPSADDFTGRKVGGCRKTLKHRLLRVENRFF